MCGANNRAARVPVAIVAVDAIVVLHISPSFTFSRYAFAVFVWEILHWDEPFPGYQPLNAAMRVLSGERPVIDEERLSTLGLSGMVGVLQRAWHQDPLQRPAFIDLLSEMRVVLEEEDGEGGEGEGRAVEGEV